MNEAYLGIARCLHEKHDSDQAIAEMEAKELELQASISLVKEQKEKRYDEYWELEREHSKLEDALEAAIRAKEEALANQNTAEKTRRDGLKESLEEVRRLLIQREQSL